MSSVVLTTMRSPGCIRYRGPYDSARGEPTGAWATGGPNQWLCEPPPGALSYMHTAEQIKSHLDEARYLNGFAVCQHRRLIPVSFRLSRETRTNAHTGALSRNMPALPAAAAYIGV